MKNVDVLFNKFSQYFKSTILPTSIVLSSKLYEKMKIGFLLFIHFIYSSTKEVLMQSDYFSKEPQSNLKEEGIRMIKKIVTESKQIIKTNLMDKFEVTKTIFLDKFEIVKTNFMNKFQKADDKQILSTA
jgi:hypothetical protein